MRLEEAEPLSNSNTFTLLNSLGVFGVSPCPEKSLVLFVDINETIIITSTRKNSNYKAAVLTLLAQHYSAIWDSKISNEEMTFKDFVKNHLYPDNEEYRYEQYAHFLEYLKDQNHPLLRVVTEEYEKIVDVLSQNTEGDNIFPSFINLINELEANKCKIPYTIILRTFGPDLENVVAELERRTSIKFTSRAHFDTDGFLNIGGEVKKSPAEVRSVIKPFEHGAWKDNYLRWKNNNFLAGGKLFPFDPSDEHSVSIFWDDCIGNKDRKILSVQLTSGEALAREDQFEEMLIQSNLMVPIITREAMKDMNYFIKLKDSALLQSLKASKQIAQVFGIEFS